MNFLTNVILAGLFQAAVLFLVAAGLQLIFGVQRIINLACGSVYALGAYFGITFTTWAMSQGLPPYLFPLALLAGGLIIGLVGIPMERVLRLIYRRPESFQLVLTFALVLMIQDIIRFFWGADPKQLGSLAMIYGSVKLFGVTMPVYNVMVIVLAIIVAAGMAYFLGRTATGKILRATAENHETSAAMGINVSKVFLLVFTLGTALGTVGGALVIPTGVASLEMGVELIVKAFAVVVIGGLGSMKGAAVGAVIVGLLSTLAVFTYPEVDTLAIYVIVIGMLIWKPSGLYGRIAT
ncbi:branched-chain amino acid ABC transporter permease [Pusillimonas noertemannii]|uniref:branched-chain amino acid ABC transporter permease n=1 Tax=Pusillimonas noertemannii TaxID=305977 RepID=UPI000302262C|nr:branched-chain amino acid ABC transporter permease [Pusillimonas noertemannii]